jgi:LPXTG-motif cell wall-anchored protein
MPVPHRRLAALIAALALAAPASAAAQSAGDDQYEDPFAGENRGPEPAPEQQQGGAGQDAPAEGGVPLAEPELQRVPDPASAAPQPDAAPASTQLPYTGTGAAPILIAGTVMLAGGVALRLRLRAPR